MGIDHINWPSVLTCETDTKSYAFFVDTTKMLLLFALSLCLLAVIVSIASSCSHLLISSR